MPDHSWIKIGYEAFLIYLQPLGPQIENFLGNDLNKPRAVVVVVLFIFLFYFFYENK